MKKLLIATLVASFGITAHAGVVGFSSNETKVKVGAVGTDVNNTNADAPINHDVDNAGKSGIAVIKTEGASSVNNKFVSIADLKTKAEKTMTKAIMNIGGLDSAGVIQLDFNNWTLPAGTAPDHSTLGKFSYKELQVDGNNDNNVYFGEWHQGASTSASDTNRTVWYVGKNDNTSVPTSGTATYAVTGINQYNGTVNGYWSSWINGSTQAAPQNLLTGTLTADFGVKTLDGTLTRASTATNATNTLEIAANIQSNGAFSGDALANGSAEGAVTGQFYGANAKALAGVATFEGKVQYDTAFGGVKQ